MSTKPRYPTRIPVAAWITREDDQALEDLLCRFNRLSRHLGSIAVVRAGLRALGDHPELLVDLIADQPRSKHVRLRTQP